MPAALIPSRDRMIFAVAAMLMFLFIFLNICIIDDAYITFRTIHNFISGFALGWNADERVQAYTHPLWMLLHIVPYALFGNIYWVTIIISLVFGLLTVGCLLRIAGPISGIDRVILVLLPLAASRIFVNYSVCGLENPLSFFLFGWVMLELFASTPLRYYRLCLIAALLITTRFDNIFLLLPLGMATAWTARRELAIGRLLLALSPAIFWYGFSLLYYGAFFPNTKYAKMHTGLETSQIVMQGLVYCVNFFKTDPIACFITLGAFCFMAARLPAAWRSHFDVRHMHSRLALLAVGFVLHVAFVISAAGDFMPGRFFANMFIVALAASIWALAPRMPQLRRRVFSILFLAIALNFLLFQPLLPDRKLEQLNGGIDDQHDWYYPTRGMLSDPEHFLRHAPSDPMIDSAKMVRATLESRRTFHLNVGAINGIYHYTAGPLFLIVDLIGIADPLLGRLPIANTTRWRVAHAARRMPAGYFHARKYGNVSAMHPSLGQYYQKLSIIISGELLSAERLKTILAFQLGHYDHLLDDYLATQK